MSNTIINLQNVAKKHYLNGFPITSIEDISLTINKGEFVVILGGSSSGKSTLLNIISGMIKASSGKVIINNTNINSLNKKGVNRFRAKDIAYTFQNNKLISNLTALENIEIAIENIKSPLDPKLILTKLGLSDKINNFPSELSGGEQQRVNIARAICKNTSILLCDEPTSSLDPKTTINILKLLNEINSTGKSVILSTHNPKFTKIADKVIELNNGKIHLIIENKDKIPVERIEL